MIFLLPKKMVELILFLYLERHLPASQSKFNLIELESNLEFDKSIKNNQI